MPHGTRVDFDIVREVIAGAIAITYDPLGVPLPNHGRLIRCVNGTNEIVYISLDGERDHMKLMPSSSFVLDFCANKIKDDGFFVAKETVFYTRAASTLPTTGSVWVEIVFAQGAD